LLFKTGHVSWASAARWGQPRHERLAGADRLISVKKAMPGMRLQGVAATYAVWILATFVVVWYAKEQPAASEYLLQLTLICGAIPVACQIIFLGVDWRGLVAPVKMWLLLLLAILLSYVASGMDPQTAPDATGGSAVAADLVPLVYTIDTIFIMGIATLVAGCPDRQLLRSIAGLYSIVAVPFLVYVLLTGERTWGRLTAGVQPILWGLLGLTICLGTFARKLDALVAVAFAVGVAGMLESSSRESELSVGAALLFAIPLYLQGMSQSRRYLVVAGLGMALVAATLFLDPYILNAIQYFKHDVLLVDSPQRGIGSGFTGRTEVWAATFDLWLRSPLFGVGFREHERFLPGGLPAHNSYLAMLADTGLVGFVLYLVLLGWSFVAAWGIRDQRTRRFIIAMIVAYIVNGFFDRRTINSGNPFGVFFLLCCAVALVDQSLRRAAKVYENSAAALNRRLQERRSSGLSEI
jgi:O-antigen ligase